MAEYRVFVTRHYIAVDYFEIEADSPKAAEKAAVKAAYAITPDARAIATDNGWIANDACELEHGMGSGGVHGEYVEDLSLVLETPKATVYTSK